VTAAADERLELDELRRSVDELRQALAAAVEAQLVYAHNLHCWARDLTVALNRVGGRRFGIDLAPPVFPSARSAVSRSDGDRD